MKTPPLDKKIQLITRQSLGSFNAFSSFNSLGGSLGKLSYYTYYNGKKSDGFRPNASYYSHNVYSFLQYKFNYKNPVFLRFGIKQVSWAIINNEEKELLVQPTLGLGLEFESFNKSIFKLDYALELNRLGVTNLISLAIKLK